MKFLDSNHPMFQKLWVRIATVVAPALWGLVEFRNGAAGWAIMFLGAAAYAAYELLYMFDRNKAKPSAEEAPIDRGDEE